MLIHERIHLIIKANKLTPSAFADSIGVKRSNLSHVLSGRNKPSLDFLAKVINHYPNVNASWLVTGETREGDFQENAEKPASTAIAGDHDVDHVAIFYKDGTCRLYRPSEQ